MKGTIELKKIKPNENHNNNYSVWFEGFNEGSCFAFETLKEAEDYIKRLIKQKKDYKIKIINNIFAQKTL